MRVKLGKDIIDLEEKSYLDEGKEGISYLFNGKVFKILHSYPLKISLNASDVERLKNISVSVLEHPIDSFYNEQGDYLGPVSTFIEGTGYYSIFNLTSKKLEENINLMINDCKKYAENNYLIGDLQYNDTIFDKNGGLHLVDSGSYVYKPNMDKSCIEHLNINEVDNYLLNEIIDRLLLKKGISKKKRDIIKNKILDEADSYGGVSFYLKEVIADFSTVDEYINKIRK